MPAKTAIGPPTLVLRGGTVFDGLGLPGVTADVLLGDGGVTGIGPPGEMTAPAGATVIDCTGQYVCPGFIDAHAHSDIVPLLEDPQPFKLLQGVTTEVNGNCGIGFAPLSGEAIAEWGGFGGLAGGVALEAGTFAQFLHRVEAAGPTNNMAYLVGHGTLRLTANGTVAALRPRAIDELCRLAAEAFEAGAVGFSTGLIYAPGCYAAADELHALARVASRFGGVYATHMRDEGADVLAAIDEAVGIARAGALRLQISHCKVTGRSNHGRAGELLDRITAARLAGIDVHGDQYPYTASATILSARLPASAHEGGPEALAARLADPTKRAAIRREAERTSVAADIWSEVEPRDILVVAHEDRSVVGRSIADLALTGDAAGDAFDTVCDLVMADPAAEMIVMGMAEDDVRQIMASPLIGVGSDSGVPGCSLLHPRAYGAFPRLLGHYVRELRLLSWEEAIRKATSHAAQHFGLHGRGTLVPGSCADVAVFDPVTVGHAGTFVDPDAGVTGVSTVILGGEPVVLDGEFTGERRGVVLRRQHAVR